MEETVTILMVDDDEVDRMAVRRALNAAGIKINWSESHNCTQAILALQQQEFDCVFLDYRLPDGDGLSLVQQIRGLGITTPLVVLTGQGDEQIAVQVMKAGASDYLSKDKISPQALYQTLRQTIRLHQAEMSAASANQKLKESEERYRLVLEAANDGIWDWYCATDEVYCNDRLLEILGVSRAAFSFTPAAFTSLMHPEDLPTIKAAISAHMTMDEKCEVEFRMRHASGEYLYCLARGKAQRDRFGCPYRMSGVLSDITERKQSEAEIVKLNRDLERRIDELEKLLDVIPIGIAIAQDPECRHIRINPALTRLLQLPSNTNASKSVSPPEQPFYKVYKQGKELPAAELPMQYAAASGKEVLNTELDVIVARNQSVVKLLSNAVPLFDEQGECRGSIGAFLDITERKQIEEQERFLAEASVILAASLDYQTILKNLAQLVVPQLADWCGIHVAEEENLLSLVTVAHVDPLKVQWAKQFVGRYPAYSSITFGAAHVIRTGQSVLYPEIPDSLLERIADDADHLENLRQVGMKSLVCVPMQARGRTLGSISFAMTSNRMYTPADLTLAEDLGRRAGLAVDNARLYQEANEIGENLRQAIMILGEQQQQLRVLQRITNLLNQRLTDLPNLLQIIVGAICDGIAEADFAVIAIPNPLTKNLELTATAGLGRERLLLSELFDADEGLLKQVFLTGKSQLIRHEAGEVQENSQSKIRLEKFGAIESDTATPVASTEGTEAQHWLNFSQNPKSKIQNPLASSPQPLAPRSIYAVAIASTSARSLGVLAVGNWHNPDAFAPEDQNLLEAVGEQAAIAINNARLINTLEEREERLEAQNLTLAKQNRELEITRQRIEQQNLQLIEAAKLKSQFLSTMSHELRTPMNAIIGFAQVLLRQRKAKLSDSQADMVDRILNNGKNLLALINDILDLSKIEAGHLELQLEQINLNKLIWSTISELKPLADQKHLVLKVFTELENPLIVNDSVRLRQVVINLLSNAIKFTESGSVEVRISERAMQLFLSIKDTGIGIAKSELEHIFEEFRQVDQTTTRKHGGTGLGLAITQSLVNMMQGKITVESKLGAGSTFCVELPREVRG
jgi:PAS domain S-box-containing protein